MKIMQYFTAILVAALWFHSMFVLLEKHKGQEPLWLKFYLIFGAIYFIAAPVFAVMKICEFFNLDNSISATFLGVTGIIMILVLINKSPKHSQ